MTKTTKITLFVFFAPILAIVIIVILKARLETLTKLETETEQSHKVAIRSNVYSVKEHIYRERCINGVVYYLFHRGASVARTPDNDVRRCSGQRNLNMYDRNSSMQVLVKDVWTSYDVMIPDKDLENEAGFTKIAKGSFEWRLNNVSQGIGQPGTYYTINSDH